MYFPEITIFAEICTLPIGFACECYCCPLIARLSDGYGIIIRRLSRQQDINLYRVLTINCKLVALVFGNYGWISYMSFRAFPVICIYVPTWNIVPRPYQLTPVSVLEVLLPLISNNFFFISSVCPDDYITSCLRIKDSILFSLALVRPCISLDTDRARLILYLVWNRF